MKRKELGSHYQIVIEKIKGRDSLTVMVETKEEIAPDVASSVSADIYDMLGFHADKLDFLPEETLPRVPGKAVRVVDKR
jgi:phenylacetate-CoA ligase